jgi:hypothetical protein
VTDEEGAKGQHWNMQVDATSVGEVLAACAGEGRALDQVMYCWHQPPAPWDASGEPLACSGVLDGRCLHASPVPLSPVSPFRCAPFTPLSFFGGVGWVGGLATWMVCFVSGYTVSSSLPTLAPPDASGQGDGSQADARPSVADDKRWQQASAVEAAAPHTTAVLTVPALVVVAAYAGAVWRGLATFPPPARSLYSFAELLPV